MRTTLGRRSVLTISGGLALGGLGLRATTERSGATQANDSFTILPGSEHETTGYVQTGAEDGPTVLVVGGIHGNEVAGYEAASNLRDLAIDRGRLVTIPRANEVAIEEGVRYGEDGADLNRQFPVGETPTTELARAIWDVGTRFDPDVVIDLHESKSLYEGDVTDGVGQAIFHSRDAAAHEDAVDAANYVNANYVDDPTYDFTEAPFSGEDGALSGLFVHKVARDTDAVAFLVETVFRDVELATRVRWHTHIVRRLVDEELLGSGGSDGGDSGDDGSDGGDSGDDGGEPVENEPPVPAIETDPADAPTLDLSKGDTVTLDASRSSDPDGEIDAIEWDTQGNGSFDTTGETVQITLDGCGKHAVALRVTDDDGATATKEVVLSTS